MPLSTIIKTGANVRSTTSANPKLRKSMEKAKELVPVLPKDDITKLIIKQAVNQLNSTSTTVESLRTLMNETRSCHNNWNLLKKTNGFWRLFYASATFFISPQAL